MEMKLKRLKFSTNKRILSDVTSIISVDASFGKGIFKKLLQNELAVISPTLIRN
jgi:hypothetical protein